MENTVENWLENYIDCCWLSILMDFLSFLSNKSLSFCHCCIVKTRVAAENSINIVFDGVCFVNK